MVKKRKKINWMFVILVIMLLIGIGVLCYLIYDTNKELDNINKTPKSNEVQNKKDKEEINNTDEEKEEQNEEIQNNQTQETVEVPKDETTQNKVENKPKSYEVSSIELIGEEQVTINKGDKYVDKGAKALDTAGNDISNQIKVDNSVDTSKSGEYTVVYSIGNYMVIRTVIVK